MSRWLAVAFALVAQTAAGHATLVATMPADGERLQQAPSAIVLEFDEPVAPLSLVVVDDRGMRHTASERARVDGQVVRLPLDGALPEGGYVASYRVASADSHVIAGAIAFSVGAHDVPQHAQAVASGPTIVSVSLRALQLAALMLTAGAAAYVVLIGVFPDSAPWMACGAAAVGVMSIIVVCRHASELAADASGAGLSHWSYTAGPCIAAIGAMSVIVALRRNPLAHRGALLGSAALLIASLGLSGHAVTAASRASAPVLLVHVAGVAFWAGSLVALHRTLASGDAFAVLRRFSSIAQVVVPVAIAAGLVFAALELGSIANLLSSAYGQLVMAKLVITAAVLFLAASNRFVLVPAFERGDARAGRRLRASVIAEIVLVASLVSLGATLGMTSLPRHDAFERTVESGGMQVRVAASSTGVVDVRFDRGGATIEPAEVWVQVTNDGAGIGPLERKAARVGAGAYRVSALPLGIRGAWTIVIRARIDDFTQHDFETTVTLP